MSITNEAEVQFVSRQKVDADYRHHSPSSGAPAQADSTSTVGFQAHYSFLPGFDNLYSPIAMVV